MDYLEFVPTITERGHIKTFLESDAGIYQQPPTPKNFPVPTLQCQSPLFLSHIEAIVKSARCGKGQAATIRAKGK